MSGPSDSGGLISEQELVVLTDLFLAFEGCPYPLSHKCKEAKNDFHDLVAKLYFERIATREDLKHFASSRFLSVIRNVCRQRLGSGPDFPCP